MKICPYCAGKLVEEAIICKHCHAHLIIGHDDQVFRNPNILFERFVPIFFLVLLSIIGSFKLFTIFESKLTIASRQKELDEISRNLKDVEQLSEKPHQNFIQEVKGFRENSYEDYLSSQNKEISLQYRFATRYKKFLQLGKSYLPAQK